MQFAVQEHGRSTCRLSE